VASAVFRVVPFNLKRISKFEKEVTPDS